LAHRHSVADHSSDLVARWPAQLIIRTKIAWAENLGHDDVIRLFNDHPVRKRVNRKAAS